VNRFTLKVNSPVEVEAAHREFTANGNSVGVTELGKLETSNGTTRFIFSDVDKNWWELTG
jgi:hypothetical protein